MKYFVECGKERTTNAAEAGIKIPCNSLMIGV